MNDSEFTVGALVEHPAMPEWGPGKVIRMDTVIASTDMVAADAKTVGMCEWYGQRFEPRQVDHIRLANDRGLGRMDVENLNVKQTEV